MNRAVIFLLLLTVTSFSVTAAPQNDKKSYVGEWNFDSPHAPESYQQGIFLIAEQENALTGEIKFSDGYKIPMRNVTYTDEGLKFDINVEGYLVNIKVKPEGEKLKGVAVTPDGNLQFEAKKNKKTTD